MVPGSFYFSTARLLRFVTTGEMNNNYISCSSRLVVTPLGGHRKGGGGGALLPLAVTSV